MAEPLDTPFDADASSETALSSEPLGIQQPLLPPQTLGQTVPNLQFMVPLGAQPLAILDPSIFFSEGGSEYAEVGQSFAESPFFDTPHSTAIDREPEPRRAEFPHPATSGTLVQRQVAAPASSTPLPSETKSIPVQEQAVEVLGTDSREPTELPDSTVDRPISTHTDTTSEFSSTEIAIASDVESSIQRSQAAELFTPTQPTVSDRSLPTQPDSTPAILSETQLIPESQAIGNPNEIEIKRQGDEETGTFQNVEATSPSQTQPRTDDQTSLETTLQPQRESASTLEAASTPSNSALVEAEAVLDTNASAIASSLNSPQLVESSNEAPTAQPATDSPVSEVLTSAPVEQREIPEPPSSLEPIGTEAIQTQSLPSEQTEHSSSQTQGLSVEPVEESSAGQPEFSTSLSNDFPSRTESPSENSPRLPVYPSPNPQVSPSPSPLEPPPPSTPPVVQTYSASESAIQREQVATPEASELEAATLPTNSPIYLQADSSMIPSTSDNLERDELTPSTPLPVEQASQPNLLQKEQVEEHLTAPSDSSTLAPVETTVNPTEVEPIQNTAIASSEPTISLHSEQIQARFEPAVSQPEAAVSPLLDLPTEREESASPGTPQSVTESVRENPTASPTSLFTPPEVTVQRSHSPSELPLPTPKQTTKAEPGTPTPDSSQPLQEPIPSAHNQNTSPQTLTPTVQTEAILQPELDSASLSTASATSPSVFDSGSLLGQSEAEATSPQNELKVETAVQPQKSSGDDIQTQALPQTTHEEATTQPVSESTTIQRQVTEVPTLSQPESNPQSLNELVADDSVLTELESPLEQSSSVSAPTPVQSETSVQELTQNAIATDSTSLPSTPAQPLENQAITPSTEKEATPTQAATTQSVSESTTIQRQVTEVPTLSQPESNTQSLNELVADDSVLTELESPLEQSSSVSTPTPVQPEASIQEPTQNEIATDSTSLPSTPVQPLENQAITPSTEEEATPTPETPIQPVSESTTIQRQVTEIPVLSQLESNPQASDERDTVSELTRNLTPPSNPLLSEEGSPAPPSLLGKGAGGLGFPDSPTASEQVVADNIEVAEPAPILQQSSSVSAPTPVQPEASVQELTQNAIATDSTSLPSTSAQPLENQALTPSTEEEATPTPEATTIQAQRESEVLQEATPTEVTTDETEAEALSQQTGESIPATDSRPNSLAISPTTQESSSGEPSKLATDSLTSTEPDLIQPFHQPGTTHAGAQPELPTVLQNLTVLNPLGSTPLMQAAAIEDTTPPSEPPPVRAERRELPSSVVSSSSISAQSVSQTASTSSNRETVASVPSVPDEWSSIAELLNRSSSPASHSSSSVSSPFPDLQPFGATETVIQAQFEPVMRQLSANPAPPSHDEERSQVTEVKADTEDITAHSPEQLEKLAREIYGLVRQRLQIEQERSGNSYLGRLPW
ncbi:MAG TPA: hypothetical protein V6C85_19390 [Allocoleopsis sp.]